ncbi:cytochrome b-245 chaperone 1 isoform X1 [Equus asinus]|uniref:Essential for reactive oxygen species protein n=3 Tax=Equus TaxID=9789 RepID=F6W2M7_HORSE|nr:uncharacterized protein C17orf62 homolog isoform X1 [Equus caballus]XP_023507475.1 uncharacterized protein C17orf62 homolog isoform X1 [Equus caballus]XP_044600244.1 cytochrome b-245 chaperone 1 isoform X1 [Equus asinus]XP_044600245.1 cytochrome b-245 chaperone 1 isoform X1 [Equus asinus]
MYMQVETRTSSCLHLKRAPGIRSWSLLVGILSIGLAAAYYSGDSLGWKLFYVTGCLFVAVQNLEDWEEAIFNKSTGKVVLKTFSLYKKLLTLSRAGHDQVVVLLNDIRDVNVEEEKVRYFGKGYVVVLRFATGFSHPLTQSAVMGHRSPSSWCWPGPVTWKPLPSSSPPSWSCTVLRVPWSCLRAATVRPMAPRARADTHGAPGLDSDGTSAGLMGCRRVFSSVPACVPGSPRVGPSAVPAACFCPLSKTTGWTFSAGSKVSRKPWALDLPLGIRWPWPGQCGL